MQNNEELNEEVETQNDLNLDDDIELDILESIKEVEDKEAQQAPDSQEAEKPQETTEQPAQETKTEPSEEIKAPAAWELEDKEWFNGLDPRAKEPHLKRAKAMDRHFHTKNQELAETKRSYSDIDQAVQPYETEWNSRGIGRAQAIQALAAANKRLETDPRGALIELMSNHGLTVQDLQEGAASEQPSMPQMTPQMQQILERQQALEAKLSQQEQADQVAKQQAELSEIYAVRDETDASGRYLRPEMHDDNFARSLMTVYNSLKATAEGKSHKEIASQAYTALTGKVVGAPSKAQANPTQKINAQRAALSVPGNSVSSVAPITDVPDSVDDTVDQVMAEFGFA